MLWDFTPEQVQNPVKLEYLEEVCCHPGNSREIQITAMSWGLAHAYQALFNTIQYPQGEEKASGSKKTKTRKVTSTAATQTSTTGTAITPTPVTSVAAEAKDQPVPVSVAPIHKKKSWKRKSTHLERDDGKAWDITRRGGGRRGRTRTRNGNYPIPILE